jgi:hypothetical protein
MRTVSLKVKGPVLADKRDLMLKGHVTLKQLLRVLRGFDVTLGLGGKSAPVF